MVVVCWSVVAVVVNGSLLVCLFVLNLAKPSERNIFQAAKRSHRDKSNVRAMLANKSKPQTRATSNERHRAPGQASLSLFCSSSIPNASISIVLLLW